jgi:ribonuclease R
MTRWSGSDDPRAQQEAEKYDNPVPSREFILQLLGEKAVPLTHRQLCAAFGIFDDERIEALRRRLRAMERDGQLMRNRRDAYGVTGKMDLIVGTVIGHRDGFGFLAPEAGGDDFYLSARQMRGVFDGDKVLVRRAGIDPRGREEAIIVDVLERKTRQLVGRYQREHGVGTLIPENRRIVNAILIPPGEEAHALSGQLVVVEITRQPEPNLQACGRIVEVLGNHMAPGLEIEVAIRNYDIPHQWSPEVMAAADDFSLQLTEADIANRFDLRDLPFCTIDGEDARDFDDAILCEPRKRGGWRLRVAIADVSHYVRPEDALDREAQNRGNSVYFPQHVVPMLPEVLSNGLCSLNPHVDRLALVCDMQITESGAVSRFQFYDAVFHSKARLTYTEVGQYLQGEAPAFVDEFRRRHPQVAPMLDSMYQLYHALRSERDKRGAIDFETTETRVIFGPDRKIERVVPVVRNDAHKLIEEAMLCANVCAARLLQKHRLVGTYRIHEGPKEEKLEKLRQFLKELGIEFQAKGTPTPADYQKVMESVQGRPDVSIIQTVMLRSMNQAVYSPENVGHFGLAYPAYTHFTSPIRRYPDLLVHRAIRSLIRSDRESAQVARVPGAPLQSPDEFPYGPREMLELSEHCSMTERRADEATRDVMAWLKCEFMVDRVGETFNGIVTAVTNFGLFVALDEIFVEGLVHVSSLDSDYYHHDAIRHRLVGERSGLHFGLGDAVTVQVMRVNLDDRKIDFEMVEGGRRQRWSKAGKGERPLRIDEGFRKAAGPGSSKSSGGKGQPASGAKGKGQPGKAQSGKGQGGKSQPGKGQPGKAQSGKGHVAKAQQGNPPARPGGGSSGRSGRKPGKRR